MIKHRYTQALIIIALVGGVFALGFYVGQERSLSGVPSQFLNTSNVENVDLAPFWKAWKILDEKFTPASSTVEVVKNQEKIWGAIQGLTASYKDPYTVFFPPAESKMFEEEISGSFGGIGIEVGVQDGVLTVVAPLKGTPAERAGVKAGDKIITIGEIPASKLSSDEAVKLIRGEAGTPIVITFARKGVNEPIVKTIVIANIEVPTIETEILSEDIFVIELYSFTATSANLFRGALREFVESGSNKLILDLRNNPGGYLEAALDMASWFLPAGKVVVTEDFGESISPKIYRSKGYDIFNDNLKFVILVNEGSASASEILA